MKKEDLLNFNFDWKDKQIFDEALENSNLNEHEKQQLISSRQRMIEIEEIKKEEQKQNKKQNGDGGGEKAKPNLPFSKMVFAFAICIFFIIFPFISRMHIEYLTDFTVKYFSSQTGKITDWFLYAKEMAIILCALGCILFYFFESVIYFEKQSGNMGIKNKSLRLPIFLIILYAIFIVLSGVFASNKEVVLMGMVKQYEGLLGTLSYLVVCLVGMNYFNNSKALSFFQNSMLILCGLAGTFALSEYYGYPLQEMDFMAHLMAPKEYLDAAMALRSSSSNVHITFFNSNYFGGFCGLMFPLCVTFAIGSRTLAKKILGGVFSAMIFIGAILSNSSGGLYTCAIMLILLAIIYIIYIIRNKVNRKQGITAFAVIVVLGVAGFAYAVHSSPEFAKRLEVVVNNGSKTASQEEKDKKFAQSHYVLTDLDSYDSKLILYSGDTSITIECYKDKDNNYDIEFFDTDNNPLDSYVVSNCSYFEDERYKNCNFKFSSSQKLYVDLGYKSKLIFQYEDGKFKPYVHGMYTQEQITKYNGPEFFKNRLDMATGRGFIWGTTISMLKDCIFLGYGNGNFVANYPQYDYVSLLEVYKTPAMVVNKPHSLYLGIATDTGVISLIVVLVLMFAYLVRGFKVCVVHPIDDDYKHMRLGLFLSVIAFMLVSIVNDSYVCVSPIFWFIFGIGWYVLSGNKIIDTD